jgi:hypothetical protein
MEQLETAAINTHVKQYLLYQRLVVSYLRGGKRKLSTKTCDIVKPANLDGI